MPPSGYSSREADSIVAFLRSCSAALRSEAIEKSLAPLQALQNEVYDIEALLSEGAQSPTTESVLRLTADFYRRVAAGNAASFHDYDLIVENIVQEIGREIRGVHVPPDLHHKLGGGQRPISFS